MFTGIAPQMPEVNGHVFRRSGKRGDVWYMKFRDVHGQHQKRIGMHWSGPGQPPAGYVRRREAETVLGEVLVAARREAQAVFEGCVVRASRFGGPPFSEVAQAWLDVHRDTRAWKPSTLRNYESMLRAEGPLMSAFAERPIRGLERREVRQWWEKLQGRLQPRNANAYLTVFRIIVRWADGRDEYHPVADPSATLRKCREPMPGKAPFFEPEEVLAIARAARALHLELAATPSFAHHAYASRFDDAIFVVAAFAGLRRAELVSLRWQNVDFNGMALYVDENVSAGETTSPKGNRARSVPMAPQVAQVLAGLAPVDSATSYDLVFPGDGRDGKLDVDALSKRFGKARERAGVNRTKPRGGGITFLSLHDLRHTFASLLARDPSIAPLEIQLAAGHASFVTTQRYMHLRPRREDAARFGKAFGVEIPPLAAELAER